VCRLLGRRRAEDWVGRITNLTTNTDGFGVVEVAIGTDIRVKTWNNNFSDNFHRTLLKPGSAVFKKLAALKEGNRIKFSGRFFPSDIDCIHEASLTLHGSMRDPEFIMRFAEVRVP